MSSFSQAAHKLFGYRGRGGSVLFFFPLLGVVGFIHDIGTGLSSEDVIEFIIFMVVFSRVAMMAIRVHDDHISVTNLLRTHRILWSDVESFTVGSLFRSPLVAVHLKDGTVVKAGGTSSNNMGTYGNPGGAGRAREITNQLTDELDRRRSISP
jgi:hypothetical protein